MEMFATDAPDILRTKYMKNSAALCLFGLMAGTTHAEQWFVVQSPVSVSVDTASIVILPSGQRRARVKHDMSPCGRTPRNLPIARSFSS